MAFKKRFKVSDETVNSHGFWIKSEGMDITQAKRNCPAYFNHRTWEIPLGHWENITKEANGDVYATIVIEGESDEEKEFIRKIENGDIKGASVGADIVTWSEDEFYMKQGQSRPALIESSLFEISLAPLPGNNNALALKRGNDIQLTSESTSFIPQLNSNNMKAIALKLGLPETATEQQILEAIAGVQLSANNAEVMRAFIDTEAAKVLLDADEKALFVEMNKSNPGQALAFLGLKTKEVALTAETIALAGTVATGAAVEKPLKVTDLIKQGVGLKKETAEGKDSFDYLQKHNPVELARIRKEEYDTYLQLARDYSNGVRYKG